MCYSFEASVTAVTVSYVAAAVLLWRRYYADEVFAAYALIVGTMQFADANLWYIYHQGEDLTKCSEANHFWTTVAYLTIMFQFVWCIFGKWIHTKERPSMLELALYGFCAAGIPPIINAVSPCENVPFHCSMLTPKGHIRYGWGVDKDGGQKCHLKWLVFGEIQEEVPTPMKFITIILYLNSLRVLTIPSLRYATMMVTFITWFLAFQFSDSLASVWCANANFISVFALIAPYLFGYRETAKQLK